MPGKAIPALPAIVAVREARKGARESGRGIERSALAQHADTLMAKIGPVVGHADDTIQNVNGIISGLREPIRTDLVELQTTLQKAKNLLADIQGVARTNDFKTDDTVDNLRVATDNLDQLTDQKAETVESDSSSNFQPMLPSTSPHPKGRRPRLPDRACLGGILFVMRSGIPWEMLPHEMGCGSGMSCWRRLRDWRQLGIWQLIHFVLLDWPARYGQRVVTSRCGR